MKDTSFDSDEDPILKQFQKNKNPGYAKPIDRVGSYDKKQSSDSI